MDEGTARAEAHRLNLRHGGGYKAVPVGDGRWCVVYLHPRRRRRSRRLTRPLRIR
jgi:hypothetical protein